MARPKVAEDTRVVSIRLPLSVYAVWAKRAAAEGVGVGTLLRVKLEEAVRGR